MTEKEEIALALEIIRRNWTDGRKAAAFEEAIVHGEFVFPDGSRLVFENSKEREDG